MIIQLFHISTINYSDIEVINNKNTIEKAFKNIIQLTFKKMLLTAHNRPHKIVVFYRFIWKISFLLIGRYSCRRYRWNNILWKKNKKERKYYEWNQKNSFPIVLHNGIIGLYKSKSIKKNFQYMDQWLWIKLFSIFFFYSFYDCLYAPTKWNDSFALYYLSTYTILWHPAQWHD